MADTIETTTLETEDLVKDIRELSALVKIEVENECMLGPEAEKRREKIHRLFAENINYMWY